MTADPPPKTDQAPPESCVRADGDCRCNRFDFAECGGCPFRHKNEDPPNAEQTTGPFNMGSPAPDDTSMIEVNGIMVNRHDFAVAEAKDLLIQLARSVNADKIEEAEVASAPDRWQPGDVVLDTPDCTPNWGVERDALTTAGQSVLVFGPDGTGKSTLLQHYAKARLGLAGWGGLLLGEPVAPLPDDQRVLYLAADRPQQIREGFKRGMTEEEREVLRERLEFHDGPPPIDLFTKAGRNWLLRRIREGNVGLLILDSYKDLVDPMDPRQVTGLNRLLKELDADGLEVMVAHHSTQEADKKSTPNLTAAYGHRNVFSGFGSVLQIKGKPGATEVKLHQVKPIRETHAPIDVLIDHAAGRLRLRGDGKPNGGTSTGSPGGSGDDSDKVDVRRAELRKVFVDLSTLADADGWIPAKPLKDAFGGGRLDRVFADYQFDPESTEPQRNKPIDWNGGRSTSAYRWVENRANPMPEGSRSRTSDK